MNDIFNEADFDRASRHILHILTYDQIEKVADWIAGDHRGSTILSEVTVPAYRNAISQVVGAVNNGSATDRAAAAKRLRALGRGYLLGQSVQKVD